MGHNEPQWRTNSSFSPPPLWRWDRQFQSDGSPHCSYEAPLNGSSLSSNSKGSRGRASSDQYTDHYHSVSDGVFSYFGSPSDNFQLPQWTPLVQKSNSGELATLPVGVNLSLSSLVLFEREFFA
uniref:Uncharacterized protein n=1 Tax=Nelumbo nucifera TaxID=4432 RepID=A0A822ZG52_NELNU|nr:TPA_asm: hypothetical protein HUJ06_000256 [Nelumbo nucifera]